MEPYVDIYIKSVGTPEARRLAELHLMGDDLRHAHRALEIAADMPAGDDGSDQQAVRISLIRDGIVQFCACFGKTEPFHLDKEVVYASAQGWEPLFNRLMDKRDAFAAHRFGPDRQCEVVAAFQAGHTPQAGKLTSVWNGFEPDDFTLVILLIRIAGEYVEDQIALATNTVNQQLAAMTQEELIALPNLTVTAPSNVRKSREKHRAAPG